MSQMIYISKKWKETKNILVCFGAVRQTTNMPIVPDMIVNRINAHASGKVWYFDSDKLSLKKIIYEL